jgi:hypothetical protein
MSEIMTYIVGSAVYFADDVDDHIGWQMGCRSGIQNTILVNSDGSISFRRGAQTGTLLGTSATDVIQVEQWHYVEFKVFVDNSSGTYEVRVDGDPVLSGENVDTMYYNGIGVSLVRFHSNYSYVYYDDIYILDTTGSYNNDFLGPQRVDSILPSASGNYTNFDPISGENWACVTGLPDGDATYVQTMSGEVTDTYTFEDISELSEDNIAGVQIFVTARKTAESVEKIDPVVRIGSTDYSGELSYLGNSYNGKTRIWERNPSDSGQWEYSDVNGAEFGFKKIDD